MCIYNDIRRPDVGKPGYMKGDGAPQQTHRKGVDNLSGIASVETRPLEMLFTEQGPVKLPYGPGHRFYTPTSSEINTARITDFAISGISDRYFR